MYSLKALKARFQAKKESGAKDEPPPPPGHLEADGIVVHIDYDLDDLPPKPEPDFATGGDEWTRFVCMSDTHTQTFTVPPGDVLLHAGDLTKVCFMDELEKTMNWLFEQLHPVKIVIAGNHDFLLENKDPASHPAYKDEPDPDAKAAWALMTGQAAQDAHLTYLCDDPHMFTTGGMKFWKVYGTPWHGDRGLYDEEEAQRVVSVIPETDILLTHGPPKQMLDMSAYGKRQGCPALAAHLKNVRPRLHVFGHIHEARGAAIHEWTDEKDGPKTVFVNAACLPRGPKALDPTGKRRLKAGDEGWRPIIVDLRN